MNCLLIFVSPAVGTFSGLPQRAVELTRDFAIVYQEERNRILRLRWAAKCPGSSNPQPAVKAVELVAFSWLSVVGPPVARPSAESTVAGADRRARLAPQ
jgi:hypothetical protein